MDLKIGEVLNGKVIKLIKIGAFVDIGNEKVGFLHISEISNEYINLPSDKLNLNDEVKVKIISIKDDKIGLSMKQVFKDKIRDKKRSEQKYETKEESFEDMMKKFKSISEQKLSDLKKQMNVKQRRSKNCH